MNLDFLKKNESFLEILSNCSEFSNVFTIYSFLKEFRSDLKFENLNADFLYIYFAPIFLKILTGPF